MLIKKSFYFTRHGETDHNRRLLCAGGGTDIPLNETGQYQARELQIRIADLPVSQVVSSSMTRARQTATLAYSGEILIEHDLREWELGEFENAPVPALIHFVETLPNDLPLPSGESKDVFFGRVVKSVNKLLTLYGDNILFVAHGGVYWALLNAIQAPDHHLNNCELIHFQASEEAWNLVKL